MVFDNHYSFYILYCLSVDLQTKIKIKCPSDNRTLCALISHVVRRQRLQTGKFFIIVTKFNIFKFITIHQKTEKINTMRGNGYRYLI